MFKVLAVVLCAISISLGKNRLIITQFNNDKEVPIVSLLVTKSIGDNVTLHCKIDGNNTIRDVKWITTPSDNFKLAHNDSSILFLSPLQRNDVGTYICASKSRKLEKKVYLFIKPEWDRKESQSTYKSDSNFVQHAFDFSDQTLQFHNNDNFKIPNWDDFKIPEHIEIPEFKEIPYKPVELQDFDLGLDRSKEVEFLKQHMRNSTYTHFKQSIYIVPVTILIVLGFVRLCYYLRNQANVPWQPLHSPECTHQICTHRRRVNPSASCILQRANSRLSVLIIQRVAGARDENVSNNNNNDRVEEGDAPPDYNDVNSNDLPPSYNEALENMNTNSSNVTNNSNLPV